MKSLLKDPLTQGILVVCLNAWASLMFIIMLRKSYLAGNSLWVIIFLGLIFISAAVCVNVWKNLFLEGFLGKKEVEDQHGKSAE